MEGVVGGGGLLCRRRPVFSNDGKHLFVLAGRSIHVYSAATGQLVSCLKGHDAEVTSIVLDPTQPEQGVQLQRKDLYQGDHNMMMPVEHMIVTTAGDAFLSINWYIRPDAGRIVRFNWQNGVQKRAIAKVSSPGPPLLCSPSTAYAAFYERHTISVFDTRVREPRLVTFSHTKEYSVVAMDASDRILAAGDVSGRILLWHNFAADVAAAAAPESSAARQLRRPDTTLHWHAHPVAALAFSPDSTVMLSGGKEATLVLWPLEAGDSKPNFLPRLGAALQHITACSADPAVFALSQWDNSLRLVSLAAMRVTLTITGLRPLPPAPASRQLLSLEPRSGCLVLGAANNSLQFYDARHDRSAYRLQVAPRNYTEQQGAANDWAGQPPPEPHVAHVAFSRDGSVMATVDHRPDAGAEFLQSGLVSSIKFWDHSAAPMQADSAAPYTLNTRVDDAHRAPVTGLAYSPAAHMAATCSGDGEFKLWSRAAVRRGGSAPAAGAAAPAATCWRCHAVGSYQQLSLQACAFSPDGSLLAVAAPNLVTLWAPDTCTLLGVLHASGAEVTPQGLQQLIFVPGTPFLVGSCGTAWPGPRQHGEAIPEWPIFSWNLLSATLEWTLQLPITASALVPCPTSGQFAVIIPQHAIFPPGQDLRGHSAAEQHVAAGSSSKEAEAPGGPPKVRPPPMRPQYQDRRHGVVLILDPSTPQPRRVYTLPPGRHERAVCVPPGSPLYAGAAAADGCTALGTSPLLVVNDSCCFYYAASKGSKREGKVSSSLRVSDGPSPLEAAFGKTRTSAPASVSALPSGEADWQQLFDAPSHMLPPVQQLCKAFLDTLVA